MSPSVMLEVSGVSHRYRSARSPALLEVSFSIRAGERTILLGPNGAGKSTLFGLLTHLLVLEEGRIEVIGEAWGRPAARADLGVVFQQPTLDLDLTVRQNLHYHGALHGLSSGQIAGAIDRALPDLELKERLDDKVRSLNGGHRRRVELVRALLHRPKILLLDEPTVGLDVPSRRGLADHVADLVTKDGLAVLWATHLIDEVREADRVLVLHRGRVRAQGSPLELLEATGAASLEDAFVALTTEAA